MNNDPKGAAGATKTPLGLIPPYAMAQTAWVHGLGAAKYGAWNWRDTGVCASTYVSAIMRHMNAWRDGEDLDPESGITHLAHVAASCNILMDAHFCGTLQDDRYTAPQITETNSSPAPKTGYVALDKSATLQAGDEYFDPSIREWAKSKYVGLPIGNFSALLYRRPIIDKNNTECHCGRIMINHWTLGIICEDCDLQWQDQY
jgi:hypothetical protein